MRLSTACGPVSKDDLLNTLDAVQGQRRVEELERRIKVQCQIAMADLERDQYVALCKLLQQHFTDELTRLTF